MIIYLIGYMGSGKSTYGKQCAEKLNFKFIDLDNYIEKENNMLIDELFSKYGEKCFRQIETAAIKQITEQNTGVLIIACGGGTPLFNKNMEYMNAHGLTIYLKLKVDDIIKHLSKPNELEKRPLLKKLNKDELFNYVNNHLNEREEYYNKAQLSISINYETFNYKRS